MYVITDSMSFVVNVDTRVTITCVNNRPFSTAAAALTAAHAAKLRLVSRLHVLLTVTNVRQE